MLDNLELKCDHCREIIPAIFILGELKQPEIIDETKTWNYQERQQ